jgi:hypothetical protein
MDDVDLTPRPGEFLTLEQDTHLQKPADRKKQKEKGSSRRRDQHSAFNSL